MHYRGVGVRDEDWPWAKIETVGVEGLRDEELLAIILRNGHRDVLKAARSMLRNRSTAQLLALSLPELRRVKGITAAKAKTLAAAYELSRRALGNGPDVFPSISRPVDALPLVADIKDKQKEHFLALFLNARNQVIHREIVSVGSLNASMVHPREVFQPAVGSSAAAAILVHNHPSGDVTPSQADIELTRRLVQAGEIMGIEILDHLIIARERFLSLKEAGLM